MYVEIEKFFKEEHKGKILFIGESRKPHKVSKIYHMFNSNSKRIVTHYPEVDIQKLPYSDNSIDYIVADQVMEHVRNPWKAINEVYRVLRPEGWAIICSCLIMHIHMYPDDYWRFTPKGLEVLCEDFNNIYQCSASGSLEVVKLCEEGWRGKLVDNNKIEKIAMKNDNKYWNNVWIIAQK